MTFLLDTNVLSTFRKKTPHPVVARWIAQTDEIATTVVTIMEIQRGIERARGQHPETARQVETWLDGMLAAGDPQVLPMNAEAARLLACTKPLTYDTLSPRIPRARTRRSDLAIAAIAIAADAVIATNNVRHFLQIHAPFPLPGLFDPFDRTWHARR